MNEIKLYSAIIDFRPESVEEFTNIENMIIFIESKITKIILNKNKYLEIIIKKANNLFLHIFMDIIDNIFYIKYNNKIKYYNKYKFEYLIYFMYSTNFIN